MLLADPDSWYLYRRSDSTLSISEALPLVTRYLILNWPLFKSVAVKNIFKENSGICCVL